MSAKSVLVTGANRGIGLELVRQLVSKKNGLQHVFACCRDPVNAVDLQKLSEELSGTRVKVHLVKLDVTDDTQIANAVKQVESIVADAGLNLLINNAGVADKEKSHIPNANRAALLHQFNVNAVSPVLVTQAFLPLLHKAVKHAGPGPMSVFRVGVINISSGLGSITNNTSGGSFGGYGYRTSKAALNMVTKNFSIDCKDDEILFISIRPGWVKTDMGGPKAHWRTEESVSIMINTFEKLTKEDNGLFYQNGSPSLF